MITITISLTQWKRIQRLNKKFPDVGVEENIQEHHLLNLIIEIQPQIQIEPPFIKQGTFVNIVMKYVIHILYSIQKSKYLCKLTFSYSAFRTKDLFDSLYVAQEFVYAWMNIKMLLGSYHLSEENFGKTSLHFEKNTSPKYNSDAKEIHNNKYDNTYMLKRSCVARVICLSNQKTTYLKNTLAAIMAETLR